MLLFAFVTETETDQKNQGVLAVDEQESACMRTCLLAVFGSLGGSVFFSHLLTSILISGDACVCGLELPPLRGERN